MFNKYIKTLTAASSCERGSHGVCRIIIFFFFALPLPFTVSEAGGTGLWQCCEALKCSPNGCRRTFFQRSLKMIRSNIALYRSCGINRNAKSETVSNMCIIAATSLDTCCRECTHAHVCILLWFPRVSRAFGWVGIYFDKLDDSNFERVKLWRMPRFVPRRAVRRGSKQFHAIKLNWVLLCSTVGPISLMNISFSTVSIKLHLLMCGYRTLTIPWWLDWLFFSISVAGEISHFIPPSFHVLTNRSLLVLLGNS